jgi:hypothetical protein
LPEAAAGSPEIEQVICNLLEKWPFYDLVV